MFCIIPILWPHIFLAKEWETSLLLHESNFRIMYSQKEEDIRNKKCASIYAVAYWSPLIYFGGQAFFQWSLLFFPLYLKLYIARPLHQNWPMPFIDNWKFGKDEEIPEDCNSIVLFYFHFFPCLNPKSLLPARDEQSFKLHCYGNVKFCYSCYYIVRKIRRFDYHFHMYCFILKYTCIYFLPKILRF